MAKKDEFNLVNLPEECKDPSISQGDFKLVQVDAKIHDQKFETKPTTFFKDSLKRFAKNKSSVVATFILGILILMSIIVPIAFNTSEVHDISTSHLYNEYLEPKLFEAGTGFWDGTKKMTDITVDTSKEKWLPANYKENAISDLVIGELEYTKLPNEYAQDGFIQFGYFGHEIPDTVTDVIYQSDSTKMTSLVNGVFTFDHDLEITNFVTYDEARLAASDEKTKTFPEGYVEAESSLYFAFTFRAHTLSFPLTEYKTSHDVGGKDAVINVKDKFEEFKVEYNADVEKEEDKLANDIISPTFQIRVKNSLNHKNSCTLIKSFAVDSHCSTYKIEHDFEKFSFDDGNSVFIRTDIYSRKAETDAEKEKKEANSGIWRSVSSAEYSKQTHYLVKAVLCSFTYDTYEAAFGAIEDTLFNNDLQKLRNKNIIRYTVSSVWDSDLEKYVTNKDTFKCEILDKENCPIIEPFTPEDCEFYQDTGLLKSVNCKFYRYKKEYNLSSMPKFLLGTDKSGKDMFIYVFKGLRTSLLLGLATSVICFLFGLIWGSISGYFGGTVDLAMERFTDILSGMPWIVVMTLTIIHLGSTFFTFALALCLTGWIGTSHTTRTQFYRFRGREYVLASRTLGASHGRLIARHILPNAMGTIITSAVLMVPSIIFSEATISYLGLGFKNLASLGVILSDNQVELTNHPYLLIFPAIIIALLMISFNLFGNGLRDAVNPSLKGEGE